MSKKILILGGRGRSSSVAMDLLKHTQAELVLTGRAKPAVTPRFFDSYRERIQSLSLNLGDRAT